MWCVPFFFDAAFHVRHHGEARLRRRPSRRASDAAACRCFCCERAVEDQQGSIALWEEAQTAIRQSKGKFPQKHIHFACVHAHNLGTKAFYYGRSQEAERWISMAWSLSNLQDLNDDQAFEKIKEVRALPNV